MKATLTYNLPDEQLEFDAAVKGIKAQNILLEMDQEMRAVIKYQDGLLPEVYDMVEKLRDLLRVKCWEEGIHL
ncbi:MAG: hypothetical protein EBR82_70900 [Caulobacteraceae bacterium]|nr:hypothetical protein [Caulobacteraceae bacterium]